MTEPADPSAGWPPRTSAPDQPYGHPRNPYEENPYQPGQYQQSPYQQSPYQPGPYQPGPYQQGAYPPGAYPPAPTPPPRRNKRRIVIAAVAAAVVVAGAVVAGVLASNSSSNSAKSSNNSAAPKKLVAPQSVGSYHIATGAAADRVQNTMRGMASGMGGQSATFIQHATITVYSDQGDAPTLIYLGMTRSDANNLGASGTDDQTFVQAMLSSAVTDTHSFDSGSHGGALRCGATSFGAASETMCAWSDSHTIGLLASVNPAKPPQQLADTANQFRDALH